jgi:hypothetical protein
MVTLPFLLKFCCSVWEFYNTTMIFIKKDVLNDEEQPFQIYLKKSFFLNNRIKRINYLYYKKNLK